MHTRTHKLYKVWAAVQIAVMLVSLGSGIMPLVASADSGSNDNQQSHVSDQHNDQGDHGGNNGDNGGDGNHGDNAHGDDNHGGDHGDGHHNGDGNDNDGDNDGSTGTGGDDGDTGGTDNGGGNPTPSADVSITKAVSTTSPALGAAVVYTLVVTNNGTSTATGVVATDLLSQNLTYVSDDSVGAYVPATGVWTIGTLANGSSTTLNITATDATTTPVANTATVTSTSIDPVSSNNTSQTVTVTAIPAQTNGGDTGNTGGTGTTTDNGGGNSGGTDNGGGNTTQTQTTSGGNGGGGGGIISGPMSFGFVNGGGQVLGTSTSASDCGEYLTSNIRLGQNNDTAQVTKLQEFLNNFENFKLAVTGVYDAPTVAAVNAFQQKYAADVLNPWGVNQSTSFVYHTTKKKINEIYCHLTKQFPLTADQLAEIARIKALGQSYGSGVVSGAPTPSQKTNGDTVPSSVQTPSTGHGEGTSTAQEPSGFWGKVKGFIFGR